MKHQFAWGVLFLSVPALLSGCKEQAAVPDKPSILVRAETVRILDYAPSMYLTGEVRAQVQSELSFRVAGRIIERNAEVGMHVAADQVLARIDPEEQRANLTAAEAAVAAAEAQLRQASSTLDRQKALMVRGYTTRRDYDSAEEAFRTARGSVDSAKAQLTSVKDQFVQTELRAGIAGVITARSAEVGQVVQAAQSVFTIAEDGGRDAVFNIPERSFIDPPSGKTPVDLSLLSDPGVHAAGKVREVSPSVDTSTGTVKVKIAIVDPPPEMELGAAVVGSGSFRTRKAFVLPWSALSTKDGKPAVWIVDPRTKAVTPKPVDIDRYVSGSVVVSAGLQDGDIVVTGGAQLLHPDQIVAMAEESGR